MIASGSPVVILSPGRLGIGPHHFMPFEIGRVYHVSSTFDDDEGTRCATLFGLGGGIVFETDALTPAPVNDNGTPS